MNNEDTGERRRLSDAVTSDNALELVCTLAMENALARGDDSVIATVETAVLKLRADRPITDFVKWQSCSRGQR